MKQSVQLFAHTTLIWLLLLSPTVIFSQSVEIDFGATGSLVGGTPGGNSPGWINYVSNENRWDA